MYVILFVSCQTHAHTTTGSVDVDRRLIDPINVCVRMSACLSRSVLYVHVVGWLGSFLFSIVPVYINPWPCSCSSRDLAMVAWEKQPT